MLEMLYCKLLLLLLLLLLLCCCKLLRCWKLLLKNLLFPKLLSNLLFGKLLFEKADSCKAPVLKAPS